MRNGKTPIRRENCWRLPRVWRFPRFCGAQNPHAGPAAAAFSAGAAGFASPDESETVRPANSNRTPYNQPRQNQGPHNNFNNGTNNHNGVRNGAGAGYVPTPRKQLGIGAPRPWVDQMRDLSPQQRDPCCCRTAGRFQNLSPDKQGRIRQQFNQWDRMKSVATVGPASERKYLAQPDAWTSATTSRTTLLPRWRQMPWDRQQVMKQKAGRAPETCRSRRATSG